MKILFIGGTGRLSSDVAKESLNNNKVYLLTRGSPERKRFIDEKYKMIYADIKNEMETKEKLKKYNFDVVIDFLSYNIDDLKRTLRIIEKRYKQYIFISSATVYLKRNDAEIISESKTEIGNDKWMYALRKYECEKYLKHYFQDKKERYTIVRPYITYNKTRIPYPLAPENTLTEYSIIKRIKDGKPIVIFDNGNTITTLTNSKDFAKGVVALFMNEKAFNTDFHITSDENVTWKDVIQLLGEYYGKKVKIENLSIKKIIKKYPSYREIILGDKGNNMVFDSSKIKSVAKNFNCEVTLKKGIYETLDFYEENEDFRKVDYLWYGRMDNITKAKRERNITNRADRIKYEIGYNSVLFFMYRF